MKITRPTEAAQTTAPGEIDNITKRTIERVK
jgi:hypothetical protein